MQEPLVTIENLKVFFPVKKNMFYRGPTKFVQAVNDVSFEIKKGETLALVGESGCGKTTIGRALVALNKPTAGTIRYNGTDLSALSYDEMRPLRRKIQFIFQDPYSSLNPRMTVLQTLQRVMLINGVCTKEEVNDKALELIRKVGLTEDQLHRFPHEFSGGQRQRISVARALSLTPELIIADEPTAALDVSIQSQILNLLAELKKEMGLTMVFISHDLSVVNYVSDRTAIMYLGHIVEIGNSREIFNNPMHPYTKALLEAVPRKTHGCTERKIRLKGSIPSPIDPPSGCPLHPRCPFATERCAKEAPELIHINNRQVACHLCQESKAQ